MKTIIINLEDKEFKEIESIKLKTGLSWREWLLSVVRAEK